MKFFKIDGLSRKCISVIFVLKIASGIVMFVIYTYYYTNRSTADIFKYFDDGNIMYSALSEKPSDYIKMITGIGNDNPHFDLYYAKMNNWYRQYESTMYNDNHTIIRFNAFVRIFSFGYYNVHSIFMNFLSLIGLLAIYKFFIQFLPDKKKEILFAVFFLPCVIFWGSGVLKEGLLIFGSGLLIYYFNEIINKRKIIKGLICIFISFVLLLYTKCYILFILIPLLIAYLWAEKTNHKNVLLKYTGILIFFLLIILNIKYIFPEYDVLQILATKQNDFINLAQSLNSGSIIKVNILRPDFFNILINSPKAFLNTLLRPHLFESFSLFTLLSAIENLLILVIGIIALFFIKIRGINKNLLVFSLFFVLITFILIGLTTPVFGAIVRYKIPALPFLIIIFIMIFDKEKFLKKFQKKIIKF